MAATVFRLFWGFTACVSVADYSKRVYQGVRVKHTVKDLLAEKRSRQTSASRFSVSSPTAAAALLSARLHLVCLTKPNIAARRSVGVIVDDLGPPAPPPPSLAATAQRSTMLAAAVAAARGSHRQGRGGKAEVDSGGRMDGLCKVGPPHLPARLVSRRTNLLLLPPKRTPSRWQPQPLDGGVLQQERLFIATKAFRRSVCRLLRRHVDSKAAAGSGGAGPSANKRRCNVISVYVETLNRNGPQDPTLASDGLAWLPEISFI